MKRLLVAALSLCIALAACGGGGSSGNSTPATKTLKVSLYGNPLVSSSSGATAKVQASAFDQAASAPAASSDTTATVQTLTDALAARGVTATVSPQVMDGTTLHQIVMGENNGLPPTPDQFKTDPSEWIILNFALDDMTTPASDPAQVAAISQFGSDLSVFTQRANVSGKRVFVVMAIPTCDVPNSNSAADGLNQGILKAQAASTLIAVGALPYASQAIVGHMGADCRTPDAYIQNVRTGVVADDIANRYKAATSGSQY